MTPPPKFKILNGERFKFQGTRYKKSSAHFFCNELRGKGFKCRIIEGGRTKSRKIRYYVYALKGKSKGYRTMKKKYRR